MKTVLALAIVAALTAPAAAQQLTPEQNRQFDQMLRDTTMQRSPDPRAIQPPVSAARPGAAYNGWQSGAFGSGDPFKTDRARQ